MLLNIMLYVFMIAGVIGTLFPVFPGTAIILLGAALHGLLTDFEPLNAFVLLALTGMSLLAWAGQYVIAGIGSRKFGSSKYGVIGACLGLVVGIFLPIPGGIFLGTFAGAFIFEICFAVKDLKEATQAGIGALVGTIASTFFELFVALIMVWIICARIF
ncbi:MAG: DUF456 domain-containing protein [Proteobacteria bacterium]|nr:DUF456 domain-containing protein [Pseudomonadota bacterium]MBU1716452.1 DUF456 domain-containing protein [Pseudomonadota bacterium]